MTRHLPLFTTIYYQIPSVFARLINSNVTIYLSSHIYLCCVSIRSEILRQKLADDSAAYSATSHQSMAIQTASTLHLLVGSCQFSDSRWSIIMKYNFPTLATKSKHSMPLFTNAVSYRIPLPVTKVIAFPNTTYPICPRCTISIEREYMSFCDRCGQKLNWDLFEYAKVIYPGN